MSAGRIPNNGTAAIQSTIVTTKGDILAATSASAISRLAVGTNGQVLTADSSEATGLKYATLATGGRVIQTITARTTTTFTNATTTPSNTLTSAITPTLNTSKILVLSMASLLTGLTTATSGVSRLFNTTSSVAGDQLEQQHGTTSGNFVFPTTNIFLDSPASTSAQTYTLQIAKGSGSSNDISTVGNPIVIILLEIGA